MIQLVPVSLRAANAFVAEHHRHHRPVRGQKFSIGAELADKLVGVVIVGRPVNRVLDDGRAAEVYRTCTDGTKNACSFLYAAAARAARELGYGEILTYTLASESGVSLRAAGWELVAVTAGGAWQRYGDEPGARQLSLDGRNRANAHPLEPKQRWRKVLR